MGDKLFNVGKIVNTHGIKGDLKVITQTDFPEVRFDKGSKLVLLDPDGKHTVEVEVSGGRPLKDMYLIRLEGMEDINLVEKYKGWSIKVREEDLLELEEGEYYYHEIIGCQVITDEGAELGTIKEILSPGANDVWVVKPKSGKEILLPVIDDVLLDVDVENKIVKVHVMEGLID